MSELFAFDDMRGEIHPRDLEVAKDVHDVLARHYPGHPWGVTADTRRKVGMIHIRLFYPDGTMHPGRYGYAIGLDDFEQDPARKCIVTAGGELLERFRLPRQGATEMSWLKAAQNRMDLVR